MIASLAKVKKFLSKNMGQELSESQGNKHLFLNSKFPQFNGIRAINFTQNKNQQRYMAILIVTIRQLTAKE